MPGSRVPVHLGGPLGILGAGLILGAGALFVTGLRGGETSPADLAAAPAAGTEPARLPPAPPVAEPVPGNAPDLPVTAAGEPEPSSMVVTPQQVGGELMPASAGDAEVVFIVRLKGEPEIDTITQSFKRDRPTAEDAFARLCEKVPELSDFTLAGASYSGEIRVSYRLPPGEAPTPATIAALKQRLLAIDGVAYADPDYVAHPGKDSPR